MVKKIWKTACAALCGLGILWFCLPALHGGFAEGSVFGIFVCGLGLGLIFGYKKMVARGGWQRHAVRALVVFYALGLGWAGFLTGLIFSYQAAVPPQGLDVVVLGAQVYSAERMGVSLSSRVDKAYEYLCANPEARCIVTGGQGGNEPCPAALTEKNALVRLGVDPGRIYMEDQSRNTRQNLDFAMEIAQKEDLGPQVVVVSQGFHLYRAVQLAKSAGFEAYGLAAKTDPVIFPQYYGRELLSLTKWWIEELLH